MDFRQVISGDCHKGEIFTPNPYSSWILDKMSHRSTYIECPFCSYQSLTIINKRLNYIAILICITTLVVFWVLVQKIRGKDLTFYNITHNCRKCESTIAEISAC